MGSLSALDRVGRLERLDAAAAGPGEVGTGLTDIRLMRGWLDSREAALALRQDELAATIGAAPAADALARSGRVSRRQAERIAARAAALALVPGLADSLEAGEVSADHVDAFAATSDEPNDSPPENNDTHCLMHRTCAVGDCPTSFDRCEIHHALEWQADQGPTDLDHLFPVCSYHHHRLREGRWRAQLDPSTRQLIITYPDGTIHSISCPDLLRPVAA